MHATALNAPRTPEQELIVLAAIDSIGAVGHHGLRPTRVANEAGVDVDDIRRTFPNPADLAEAVAAEVSGRLERTIDAELAPADRLRLLWPR
jgi:AcrR family transcriptional regulator